MGLDVEAALKVPLVYSNSNDDLALNYSLPDLIVSKV